MASQITWREVAAHYQEIMNGLVQANATLNEQYQQATRRITELEHAYEELRNALTTPAPAEDVVQEEQDRAQAWPAPSEAKPVLTRDEAAAEIIRKALDKPDLDRDAPVTYGWGTGQDDEFETTTVGELLDRAGFIDYSYDPFASE